MGADQARRRRRLTARAFAAAALVAFGAAAGDAEPAEACDAGRVEFVTGEGAASFAVEVVDTAETRARGLMFRESMPADHGMLFVYPSAQKTAFWMKNTPLPLDIVFMNRRGVVCSIARDTTPFSLDPIPSGCAAQTVLEVNAGQAAAQGVSVGTAMRHPAIEDPAWPCP
ncbi:MAG: DUF192 domain-containing protein [Pseudomonadota bacterium]